MNRYLTFDDIGLIPKYNTIKSRQDTDISTTIDGLKYNFPFVPANMDTVISEKMADIITEKNGMLIYHRFCTIKEKLHVIKKYPNVYMSCGVNDMDEIKTLIDNGCNRFCIDVAHGHCKQVIDVIKFIKDLTKTNSIIAGNVCTYDGYVELGRAGANIIKCGVGGGCLGGNTRILLSNGTYKNISEININDEVINMDGKPVKVINVINKGIKNVIKIEIDHIITFVTEDHLYYILDHIDSKYKWKEIGKCCDRDFFTGINDSTNIFSIHDKKIQMEVWDIEVDCPTHSFIANNVIVHNSVCTTRMKTGFGVPQFSAVLDCQKAKLELQKEGIKTWLISDGGIKHPRDAVFAIAAGADMVMMGNLFAKTFESAGKKYIKNNDNHYELIDINYPPNCDEIYSHYRGQASLHFMNSYYGTKKAATAEGVDFYTKCLGSTIDIINEYSGSLRSALTYAGSDDLEKFRQNAEFFESTPNYMSESNARINQ